MATRGTPSHFNIGRGGGRGRGRSRGHTGRRGGGFAGNLRPIVRELREGLDPSPLETLTTPEDDPLTDYQITDLTYIGSYNWVDDQTNTIVVPGSPRRWQDRSLPFNVRADHGFHYIDQNGHRLPSTPLLPLFRAVDVVAESKNELIDWTSVDFVTDRNNLRKLLQWVRSEAGKPFRIDLQLAGNRTVLMSRWEARTACWYNKDQNPTYGFNFEDATTQPVRGCENAKAHHRIVKYEFGIFTMVVRFEVDAYIPNAEATVDPVTGSVDALLEQMAGLSVSSASTTVTDATISVTRGGGYVEQSTIAELTTRSETNSTDNWPRSYPQLYLSQTPHYYFAVHSKGKFIRLKKRDLQGAELEGEREKLQGDFRKLVAALTVIQDMVIASGKEGRYSLVYENRELKAYRRSRQGNLLPDDVLARFGD